MGDDHPNAVAYRRTADAFRDGDLATVASLISPRVVWHVPGSHPRAGEIRGREELLRLLRWAGTRIWLREIEVFGNDRCVFAISQMGARQDGVDVSTRVVSAFSYSSGVQLERWFYPDDPSIWDAMFSE